MKLRIARKIIDNIANGKDLKYSRKQCVMALRRYDKTQSSKLADKFWDDTMKVMGPHGRADFFLKRGCPGIAFNILLREVEGVNLQPMLSEDDTPTWREQ